MKGLFTLWSFIPSPAKVWVMVGLAVAVMAIVGTVAYKIDRNGYNRCQEQHALASAEAKDVSRKKIIEAEKRYDKIKSEIAQIGGDDAVCGPRITHAIDSL